MRSELVLLSLLYSWGTGHRCDGSSLKIKFSDRWKPHGQGGQDPRTEKVQRPCRRTGLWL